MAIGSTFIIIAALVAAIWIIIEIKRLKHKIFAMFLIGLILFTYISFTAAIKDQEIDLKTVSGVSTATKLYFSWLGNAFQNVKSVTTYALKQNWSEVDESVTKNQEESILDKI
jgi:hypothetical protein